MRNALGVALTAMLVGGTARAQELSLFASEMQPGPLYERSHGFGGSVAGFVRLGSAFHPQSRLSRMNTRLGLRVAYVTHHSSQHRESRCFSFDAPCSSEPHAVHGRLVARHASLLLGLINRPSTRVEIGAGGSTFRFSGETQDHWWGLTSNLTASIQIAGRWWATADYARHALFDDVLYLDSARSPQPDQSLRLGVMYRVQR